MKPINVARFLRVFAFVALITLGIEVKLGHADDCMWVFPLLAFLLLYMFIISNSLIEQYKQDER